jgi:DNA-binding transcriptional MerR regulator
MARASSKPAARKPRRSPAIPTAIGERPLKIGEAARLLGVEAYVLRFWETQFPFLRPRHASSSHRMYQARDIELLQLVKRLLHVEGYTIAGAKKHIREIGLERLCGGSVTAATAPESNGDPTTAKDSPRRGLAQRELEAIRTDLESLRKLLENS